MNLESLEGISYRAKYQRILRLLKSYYYVLGKSIRVGQSILYHADDKAFYFLSNVIKLKKINNYDISCIINCDETYISFDSPMSYSLAKIGKKTVMVKTNGKEKSRISCLLTITASGQSTLNSE